VVPGHQRGKGLGFPTANIASETEVLPSDGIYATYCRLGDRRWPGVTNIGHNPTFGDGDRTVESFLLDYKGDLYGQAVQIFFVKRIREEKKFPSVDLLVEQIQRDVSTAREIFREIAVEERPGLEK
jgi:riboflavin kinase/FMN adenylyltransferase